MIAYVTAYLKRHYLGEFTCALLNAQPMGFYSTSSIVEDARRHGLTVLPLCVMASDWDCTIEDGALRMGLRWVKGMSEGDGRRVVAARGSSPFTDLDDFVRRTGLDRKSLDRLTEAGGLEALEASRREALWSLGGLLRTVDDLVPVASQLERLPPFPILGALEKVNWDHRASEHSARGHPLAHLRDDLRAQGFPDARGVATMPDGAWVSYAGLVICRQRPGTASGVVFMTLEDETGFVNVVVWPSVFDVEANALILRTTSFLGVSGGVQAKDGVVHIIAQAFWRATASETPPEVDSRNFH